MSMESEDADVTGMVWDGQWQFEGNSWLEVAEPGGYVIYPCVLNRLSSTGPTGLDGCQSVHALSWTAWNIISSPSLGFPAPPIRSTQRPLGPNT